MAKLREHVEKNATAAVEILRRMEQDGRWSALESMVAFCEKTKQLPTIAFREQLTDLPTYIYAGDQLALGCKALQILKSDERNLTRDEINAIGLVSEFYGLMRDFAKLAVANDRSMKDFSGADIQAQAGAALLDYEKCNGRLFNKGEAEVLYGCAQEKPYRDGLVLQAERDAKSGVTPVEVPQTAMTRLQAFISRAPVGSAVEILNEMQRDGRWQAVESMANFWKHAEHKPTTAFRIQLTKFSTYKTAGEGLDLACRAVRILKSDERALTRDESHALSRLQEYYTEMREFAGLAVVNDSLIKDFSDADVRARAGLALLDSDRCGHRPFGRGEMDEILAYAEEKPFRDGAALQAAHKPPFESHVAAVERRERTISR